MKGEILSKSKSILPDWALTAYGTQHKIKNSFFSWYSLDFSGASKHMMGSVFNALKNEGIK